MVAINYDWDELEDNIDEEYDDSGNTIAEYTTEPEQFGNVISQRRGGQSSFLHCDGLGSTLALTNGVGTATDTYAYSAFGEPTEHTGSTDTPFHYVGRKGYYNDSFFGDYLVRRRPYSPASGRWLSRDPFVFADVATYYEYARRGATHPYYFLMNVFAIRNAFGHVEVNPYTMASSNPVVFHDPSGLIVCKPRLQPHSAWKHHPDRGKGEYWTDVDSITSFNPDFFLSYWLGDVEITGTLVAQATMFHDRVEVSASAYGELWILDGIFGSRFIRYRRASGYASGSCEIHCNATNEGTCVASATCAEIHRPKKISDYWAVAFTLGIAGYNGPVVSVEYGAQSVFSFVDAGLELNFGFEDWGATIVYPAEEWSFEAKVAGIPTWVCECQEDKEHRRAF